MNATIRPFASFRVGERAEYVRTVTESDVTEFARISGDDNALHLDEAFGARTRFGGRVAHGALSFGFLAASQTRIGSPPSRHRVENPMPYRMMTCAPGPWRCAFL